MLLSQKMGWKVHIYPLYIDYLNLLKIHIVLVKVMDQQGIMILFEKIIECALKVEVAITESLNPVLFPIAPAKRC